MADIITIDAGIALVNDMVTEIKAPKEKRPLYRALPPATDFPVTALGPLQHVATAIQQQTQAPFAICAQSVLSAATLAVQGYRDVNIPGAGRRPLSCIFATVAESGERKTSADAKALVPIKIIESEWRKQFIDENEKHHVELAAWQTLSKNAKKVYSDRESLISGLNEIGGEPKLPLDPTFLLTDPTAEAIILRIGKNRGVAGLFNHEAGLFFGGAGFTEDRRMGMAATLNTFWDGETIRRDRVTTGATLLEGRRLTAHFMMQPAVANVLFNDPMIVNIGLTARILLAAPDSTAGTRFFRDAPIETMATLLEYNQNICSVLRKPFPYKANVSDALDPPAMHLSPAAKDLWIAFHNECERAIASNGTLASIRAFGAKLPEHAGRLAAVLTVYHNPDAMDVHVDAMKSGIALAYYYASEMLRLQGSAQITQDLITADKLLRWWQNYPTDAIYLSKIYQFGAAGLRTAKDARQIAKILEEHGQIERLQDGMVVDDKPRKEVWRLRLD